MMYMMYFMEVHKAIIHLCLALLRLGRMIVAVFASECWVKLCTRSYQEIFEGQAPLFIDLNVDVVVWVIYLQIHEIW